MEGTEHRHVPCLSKHCSDVGTRGRRERKESILDKEMESIQLALEVQVSG